MNLKERAKQLKINIPAIYIALHKKETPLIAKVLAVITIAYALSPIDLIPDFIPVLGLLDDIILLPIFIALTIKYIPEHVLQQCKVEAAAINKRDLVKWYYAIPILLIWLVICILLYKLIIE